VHVGILWAQEDAVCGNYESTACESGVCGEKGVIGVDGTGRKVVRGRKVVKKGREGGGGSAGPGGGGGAARVPCRLGRGESTGCGR
jgi:hypothetical protein